MRGLRRQDCALADSIPSIAESRLQSIDFVGRCILINSSIYAIYSLNTCIILYYKSFYYIKILIYYFYKYNIFLPKKFRSSFIWGATFGVDLMVQPTAYSSILFQKMYR